MSTPADKLALVYIKIRDAKKALKDRYEAENSKLESQLDIIGQQMLDLCRETGADSLRTVNGTIIRSKQTRYWPTDWQAMHNFVLAHKALHLLERRVAQKAMEQWIKENPDDMPPGLNVDSRYVITVRRGE